MNNIVLLSITTDELRDIVADAVSHAIENHPHTQSSTQQHPDEFLSREETRRMLRLSLPTLRNLERRGVLTPSRIARRVLYSKAEILRVLDSRRQHS